MSAAQQHTSKTEAGFTLIEVLISMFIFSIISVGAMIALTSTLDVRSKTTARMDALNALSAARRIMADDIGAWVYRQNRDGLGSFIDKARQIETPDRISFTRRGRANPGGIYARGDLWRVSYRVEDGALIRSFLPHENPAQIAKPIDRVLLNGVEAMAAAYIFGDLGRDASALSGLNLGPNLPNDTTILNAGALSIALTHSDGTMTEHLFELPDA